MSQTTPTRDEAVPVAWIVIDDEGHILDFEKLTVLPAGGHNLYLAPAPASGRVDAVWKALDTANHVFHFDLRHMIEWGDDYNQAVKDASDRVAAALASLSPAATFVSEAKDD